MRNKFTQSVILSEPKILGFGKEVLEKSQEISNEKKIWLFRAP